MNVYQPAAIAAAAQSALAEPFVVLATIAPRPGGGQ
jgi:hypothetical protein